MQGDHEPGKEPGDIVIQLEEKEHATFQRHGKDLTMKYEFYHVYLVTQTLLIRMDIDISESLCGMSRAVKTLDGRTLVLTTVAGEIVKQAAIKMIKGEGMPTYRVS